MKILIIPDFTKTIAKAMNIRFDDIPWDKFKYENIGKVDFLLTDKDTEFILDVNKNFTSMLGLEEINLDAWAEYKLTDEYLHTFLTKLEKTNRSLGNASIFKIYKQTDEVVIIEIASYMATYFTTLSKNEIGNLLNELSLYFNHKVLFELGLTVKTFRY
ncbi:MAG: hypothetical protein DRP93_01250 [Candidatus Neomarinimicrobiota bacterium]|nr:MAG: hypothetical protein DRP93_01250 [Candidatus Neomarinimicrobiota bacterium]